MTASHLCVLDASVAGGWLFIHQSTPYKAAVADAIATSGRSVLVPALWHLEIANLIARRSMAYQLSDEAVQKLLQALDKLTIVTDEVHLNAVAKIKAWKSSDLVQTAITNKLTSYDALYLQLAMRTGLPLATADEALMQAAKRSGVQIFQP
jgi:predicted nucleic acid-binding protein